MLVKRERAAKSRTTTTWATAGCSSTVHVQEETMVTATGWRSWWCRKTYNRMCCTISIRVWKEDIKGSVERTSGSGRTFTGAVCSRVCNDTWDNARIVKVGKGARLYAESRKATFKQRTLFSTSRWTTSRLYQGRIKGTPNCSSGSIYSQVT
ncbi:hypothetical protein PPTG_20216 [Phytophthora nicotianae INRA-310]|uniref:Uncharacterized protein n=1 Tax=Phytophthora nicotianae (strain INRA-310) TaxID=761204 RepID=W2P953_PHYN3|nr:hypothetical protein PPTG_20216 [Phytophthora nicotianae INRA-310]ETM97562.1 hypothetical protein PPTG_20216 [Phytophthora nicotianae INRA-310]